MFQDNLKALRKSKGLSQENLAIQLNVVRQTVSKWEKGLSVPDAEMLISLSETLDTSVAILLGETVETPTDKGAISQQLEQLNTILANKNRRSRRTWKIVKCVFIGIAVFTILVVLLNIAGPPA